MPAPYSEDLGEKIVINYFWRERTLEEIAESLPCNIKTVHDRVHRFLRGDSLKLNGRRGTIDSTRTNNTEVQGILTAAVAARETVYLDELVEVVEEAVGIRPSISTVCRGLFELGLTRKKLLQRAVEAREDLRADFAYLTASFFPRSTFIWIDEAASDERTSSRPFGRAPKGRRTMSKTIFVRGQRFTVIGAMSVDGTLDWHILPGAACAENMVRFAYDCLAPHLSPFPGKHSVVVADGCAIHKDPEFRYVIEQCGARLVFLPPYSPDYNPIELVWSQMKSWLKTFQDWVNREEPSYAVHRALLDVTAANCNGYITHCRIYNEE